MEALIGAILGFVIGIPVVKAFLDKATVPIKDVAELVLAVIEAIEDGKVTTEEVKKIVKEAEDLRPVLSLIKGFVKSKEAK